MPQFFNFAIYTFNHLKNLMGNSFGTLFRISSWGESHGGGIGVVIDGCPPRLPLGVEDIQPDLTRRRPGQSKITTPRDEADKVEILSGVFDSLTLGTPIAMLVRNQDARPQAYDEMKEKFRPSHADFTYQSKFGHRNHEGGGRSSARETIARVAAGAVAKKILSYDHINIRAYVERIHDIQAPSIEELPTLEQVESSPTRCPHSKTAELMEKRILEAKKAGDSVGGSILCRVTGLPVGWGAPVFDR
ncbi:MAG: chorismate synthase, partial [Opitutales bacterium]|nr:chorismate synthase [Opitutales bacterium]